MQSFSYAYTAHIHTYTHAHSYICFVHQGASSFYDKIKVGVQIFTCYLVAGNWKQETTPFMEWKGPALSMMNGIMSLTECSLYSPLKKHRLSAEAGVIGRRAGCSTQI